jgi:hypothetical protein
MATDNKVAPVGVPYYFHPLLREYFVAFKNLSQRTEFTILLLHPMQGTSGPSNL